MSFTITEIADGKIVEVDLSGKLTHESYEKFVPLTEKRIEQYGKISLICIFHDFHGWEASALWDDIKFDVKHFNDIERLALVGDKKWEKGMSVFCRPFTTAEIKFFELEEVERARAWVQGGRPLDEDTTHQPD